MNKRRFKRITTLAIGMTILTSGATFIGGAPASASAPGLPSATATRTAQAGLYWEYCIRWNGQPQQTYWVYAPDPTSANATMGGLIAVANLSAQSQGYPPLWSASAGAC